MDLSSLENRIRAEYGPTTAWIKNHPWWSVAVSVGIGWLVRYGQDAVVGLFHRVFG